MAFQLPDNQVVPVAIQPLDSKNNPAPVDGAPQWQTDNTELLSLAPAADGMSCDVAAVGPLGTGVVSVSADADLGAGVERIVGTFEVQVTGGKATQIAITPGTPRDQ